MRAFSTLARSVLVPSILGLAPSVGCQSEGTARDEDNRRTDITDVNDAGPDGRQHDTGMDAALQSPDSAQPAHGSSGASASAVASGAPPVDSSPGPEELLIPGWGECDDTDPSLYQLVAYDADGDGFAAETEDRILCVGDAIPDHYVRLDSPYDCDDGNADIHPDATDPWGDGVDWDCDLLDPPNCAHRPRSNDLIEVPLSDACVDAPDVFLSMPRVLSCMGPTHYYFFIGNQGHVPFDGTIAVKGMRGDFPLETPTAIIEGPLAPGEWTEVFDWKLDGDVDIVVELSDSEGQPVADCDGTNQVVSRDEGSVCDCR